MIHVCLGASLLVSMAVFKTSKGERKSSVFIGLLLLFVLAALRNDYGNDFAAYQRIFVNAHEGLNSANIEIGFFELNKLFPSFHLLLAVLSLFYLAITYKLIVNNVDVKYQWLSVFILIINPYLFLMSLSSLRQTLALCIFVLALNIKCKRKIIEVALYVLLIAIAAQMHQTAWLLLPMYLLFNLKKTKLTIQLERIIFTVIPIALIAFSPLLNKLISLVLDMFSNNLNYQYYITENTPNSLRATLLSSVYYVYVLINLNKLEGKAYQYSRMYLFGLLFALLAYRYSMFTRFQMYFDLFSIVSLPVIFKSCKEKSVGVERLMNVYAFPALIILIFLLRYYSFFTNSMWEYFFTYQTFL